LSSSTLDKIDRQHVITIVKALADQWKRQVQPGDPPNLGLAVVGSVARGSVKVGDLELIAPLPGPIPQFPMNDAPTIEKFLKTYGTIEHDLLYTRIFATVKPTPQQGSLWGSPQRKSDLCFVEPQMGFKPGFKYCDLLIDVPVLCPELEETVAALSVQIHRYWLGPAGNRGWIQLMRTGPAEFGQYILTRWKEKQRLSSGVPGSVNGFLVDRDGKAVPTPEEADVFAAVGIPFIPVDQRERFMERVRGGLKS
jgi:hypothetical protein